MGNQTIPFSESASAVRRDGSHRLAMLAISAGSPVVVWTYTLNPDLVGTWDDTRHVFATWHALHAHFANTEDAPLMAELQSRYEAACAG